MNDLLDRVRDANCVPRNAWSTTVEGQAARERAFAGVAETIPHRRRRWPALVAAVLVLVLVAAVAVVSADQGSEPTPIGRPPTLKQLTTGTWDTLPSKPIAGLHDAVSLWTGKQLLVWSTFDDRGAALDPRTRKWTTIPASGVVDGETPVWAGDRMIVWAGATPDSIDFPPARGASYDPRMRQWTPIAEPPVREYRTLTTWTGRELVVVGAGYVCRDTTGAPVATADCSTLAWANAAYSPSTDSWRMLPDWPGRATSMIGVAWDGGRVVTLTNARTAWSLEPSATEWHRLGDPPFQLGLNYPVTMADGSLIWIGNQTAFPDGIRAYLVPWQAMRLASGSDDWVSAAPVFDGKAISPFASVRIGSFLAVRGGPDPSAVLDTVTGSWHRMPSPPRLAGMRAAGAFWTGTEVLELVVRRGGWAVARYTPGS